MSFAEGKPDFLVLGAPRCGTTSLHYYFLQHPDIFVPREKEPHFFCTDLLVQRKHTRESYLSLFNASKPKQTCGEVSVWYLLSETAPAKIANLCGPDTRLIMALRNPVQAAHSLWRKFRQTAQDPCTDFLTALRTDPGDRYDDVKEPSLTPQCLNYKRVYAYKTQIRRYRSHFDDSRLLPIVFDDFSEDTPREMKRVFKFLGVSTSPGTIRYDSKNRHAHARTEIPRILQRRWGAQLGSLSRKLLGENVIRRTLSDLFWRCLRALNRDVRSRPEVPPRAFEILLESYSDDIQWLEDWLRRDLSHWQTRQTNS